MLKTCSIVVALALIAVLAAPAGAQSPRWTQAGMLKCVVNPSIGFIIAGHQSMECRFQPAGPYSSQAYEGAINTVGLDFGVTAGGVLAWTVFGPATGVPAGALAGEYVGASGDVGIGVGAGANVLVGGFHSSIALQPVSIEGQNGLNVAAGVMALNLTFNKEKPAKSTP